MDLRTHAAPVLSAESRPFWEAARASRLLIKHCDDCGRPHWYPRALCPFCWSAATRWIESAGTGEVYSLSVMRRARPPYVLAYVRLDEGPTLLTNLVADDLDTLAIGQRVRVVWAPSEDGGQVPVFTPIEGGKPP